MDNERTPIYIRHEFRKMVKWALWQIHNNHQKDNFFRHELAQEFYKAWDEYIEERDNDK